MKKDKYLNQKLDPELAALLAEMRDVPSRDPQEVAKRKARYLSQIDQMSQGNAQITQKNIFEKFKETFNMSTPKLRTVMTTATIMLLAVVILFSSAGITAAAASRALPGDNLYGIKTGVERTRLNMTSQDSERVSLNLRYASLRLDEIERLIEKGRFNDLPEAIRVYELYVKNALEGLEVVSANDPQAALQLNSQLTQLLSEFAAAMATYSAALPASAKTPVDNAIDFSRSAGAYKGELEFTGTVEAIQGGYWTIGGFTVVITEATEIEGNIRIGEMVKVETWVDMQGNIYAEEIEYYDDMDDDYDDFSKSGGDYKGELKFTGTVEAVQGGYWTIGGFTVAITEATEIEGSIRVGDKVEVEAWVDMYGKIYAEEIEYYDDIDDDYDDFSKSGGDYKGELKFTGTVEAVQGGYWTIGGYTVIITKDTEIDDNIHIGDLVEVEAWVDMQGNIYAEEIEYYDDMDDDYDDDMDDDHDDYDDDDYDDDDYDYDDYDYDHDDDDDDDDD